MSLPDWLEKSVTIGRRHQQCVAYCPLDFEPLVVALSNVGHSAAISTSGAAMGSGGNRASTAERNRMVFPGNRLDMQDKTKTGQRKSTRPWLWFVGLYVTSLAAFAVIVYLLRWLIL